MKVYVVTSPELGWDCVCGVFTTIKKTAEYVLGDDFVPGLTNAEYEKLMRVKRFYIVHEQWLDR